MRNKAFSLLELIVTIAILSIGVILIIQSISFSAQAAQNATNSTQAAFLAQDILQKYEYEQSRGLLSDIQEEGERGRFQWRSTINLLPESDLYMLNLIIGWNGKKSRKTMDINTYVRAR